MSQKNYSNLGQNMVNCHRGQSIEDTFLKITIYTIYSHLQIHIVNKIKSYVITDTEPLVILNSL